jgi:DNA-binding helix-hairpin-helix protein with protein kinase domain
LCSGIAGIAWVIGFGSMYQRSVAGNLMSAGFANRNFTQAKKSQSPRRTSHISIPG